MSYILDALKRADAERERGVVPGLYARQLTSPAAKAARRGRSGVWLALIAVVALAGIAAGLWLRQTPVSAVPRAVVEPTLARPKQPAPLAQPLAPPTAPAASAPAPEPAIAALPAAASTAVALAATPVKPRPLPAPPAKASASPPTVLLLSELSEEIRRQIPALAITGAVYSESPGQRLLLVNNQVLSQGSLVAPELKLEEIGARSSVFSFRGTRFRLTH